MGGFVIDSLTPPDNIRVLSKRPHILAECPFFDPKKNEYSWVDIGDGTVSFCSAINYDVTEFFVAKDLSTLYPLSSGLYVGSAGNQVIWWDRSQNRIVDRLSLFPDSGRIRLNDGRLDEVGQVFYVGSMDREESEPLGSLYRIDLVNKTAAVVMDGLTISNGILLRGREQAVINSPKRQLISFAPDSFGQVTWEYKGSGVPDGLHWDDNDIYVAIWGEGKVVRKDCSTVFNSSWVSKNATSVFCSGKWVFTSGAESLKMMKGSAYLQEFDELMFHGKPI